MAFLLSGGRNHAGEGDLTKWRECVIIRAQHDTNVRVCWVRKETKKTKGEGT